MDFNKIYLGDCLALMKDIPTGSIDMILCDLPYGTTKNKWDTIIPFDLLWVSYKRILKPSGVIVLTGQGIFSAQLIVTSPKGMYRYTLIWQKTHAKGFLNANKMPLRSHEDILVFYKKLPTYNPQKTPGKPWKKIEITVDKGGRNYGKIEAFKEQANISGDRHPTSVIRISNFNGALFGYSSDRTTHPTQKPVPLFEYLIKTYTNEGDTVLDNCSGSGTTAIACLNTNRNFICMEMYEGYYNQSIERLNNHISNGN